MAEYNIGSLLKNNDVITPNEKKVKWMKSSLFVLLTFYWFGFCTSFLLLKTVKGSREDVLQYYSLVTGLVCLRDKRVSFPLLQPTNLASYDLHIIQHDHSTHVTHYNILRM